MKRSLFLALTMLAGVLLAAANEQPAPVPTTGELLYARKCGICHAEGGTGTIMLGWRLGREQAVLAKRTDVAAEYVKAVVRSGLNSMPAITRVEVTDEELSAIADYLARDTDPGADPDE